MSRTTLTKTNNRPIREACGDSFSPGGKGSEHNTYRNIKAPIDEYIAVRTALKVYGSSLGSPFLSKKRHEMMRHSTQVDAACTTRIGVSHCICQCLLNLRACVDV